MSNALRQTLLFAAIAVLTLLPMASASAGIDWTGPEVPSEGLRIDSELLQWGSEGGIRTLTHGGRPVVSTTTSYATPAFTILDIWNGPETNAVLLQAGVTATRDCSIIYVVESRQPQSVAAHELGTICVGFTPVRLERNDAGFFFSSTPSPRSPVEGRQWQARTGDVATSKIAFYPEPHTTMAGLLSQKTPKLEEPLRNEEFFAAVSRLPLLQRDRLLTGLWEVTDECLGCSGTADRDLYGVAIDERTAAYSGCGWYMDGARVHCRGSDALAVWDREGGGFYFATDVHRGACNHENPATLTASPGLENWPPAARDKFEAWRDCRAWPKAGR